MDVIGCTPIQLEEGHVSELKTLLAKLCDAEGGANEPENESALERFEKLVLLYSDEPQLLDPIIPEMVNCLLKIVKFPGGRASPSMLTLAALNRLRVIIRTRGYKVVVRVLPHDVNYMEKLLQFLEYYTNGITQCAFTSTSSKSQCTVVEGDRRAVYVLVVWLLIVCKNPFSLALFNPYSTSSIQQEARPVYERLVDALNIILRYYAPLGEMRVVSTLLAQLLTRVDGNAEQTLEPVVDDCLKVIAAFESEVDGGRAVGENPFRVKVISLIQLITSLQLLVSLFKWGRRKEMLPFAEAIFNELEERKLSSRDCTNTEVRNLTTKLLQRLAVTLLKPRLADWRYKCGVRDIRDSLGGVGATPASHRPPVEGGNDEDVGVGGKNDEEGDDEIPYERIEIVVGHLLARVHDRDNVVRWTAAKGLARVSARLPLKMASEVVTAVVDTSFRVGEPGSSWHGGCLAMAELCRRGCLLPQQIPSTMGVLGEALLFEQSHVGFALSVGVRDAACYICWAFARAYESNVLRLHLPPVGAILVCLALFDREVNIRRAASAAFQE